MTDLQHIGVGHYATHGDVTPSVAITFTGAQGVSRGYHQRDEKLTDLQHDIVAAFRDGGGPQAIADRFAVSLPQVHYALRVALRESWMPAKPIRPDLRVDPRERTPLKSEPMLEREYT